MFLLVPAYPGGPGQKAVKRLCVCVAVRAARRDARSVVCSVCLCVGLTRKLYIHGWTDRVDPNLVLAGVWTL